MAKYPKFLDVTPITIQRVTKTYDGLSETTTENLKVRMVEKIENTKDDEGIDIKSLGHFYKNSEIDVNYGDKLLFGSKEYVIKKVYKPRWKNGKILYTKAWFK